MEVFKKSIKASPGDRMLKTVSLARSLAIAEIVGVCVCLRKLNCPYQNCATIRQDDVPEENGFVCLRTDAFPVIP